MENYQVIKHFLPGKDAVVRLQDPAFNIFRRAGRLAAISQRIKLYHNHTAKNNEIEKRPDISEIHFVFKNFLQKKVKGKNCQKNSVKLFKEVYFYSQ